MIKTIKKLLSFPVDSSYKKEIMDSIANEYYKILLFVGTTIIIIQIGMLISGFLRGAPTLSYRRTLYITLYSTLIVSTLFFLVWLMIAHRQKKSTGIINICFSLVMCLWSCGISLLDMYRASNISVFSYVTMSIAVFCLLTPIQSLCIFFAGFAIINASAFILSGNEFFFATPPHMFGLVINSGFVATFSFIISVTLYRYRILSHHNDIILKAQYNEICQINRALDTLSKTDQLTEIGNRRFLVDGLAELARECSKNNTSVTGMMLDIDFFKSYNDFYGHPKGDTCLKEIANTLVCFSQKENAVVARYGGEEFFIYAVNSTDGFALAQKLREFVQSKNIYREDTPPHYVTVSIGVCTETNLCQMGIDEFITKCDKALYQAKNSGRNCVCSYS